MASGSLPQSLSVQGTAATNGGQSFGGLNLGTINYASNGNRFGLDPTEQAAIACRDALFLTDPYVDRESVISAKGTRVAGTCEWITRNERYRA
ncbi:uncharacterized protein N0V89_008930 [Didymosphaeria variabile]|uniref:Uncharacterized protein n=1 Tax=Didymosphaeria variabile TaxID=1932322 RepID=A0A9W8XIL8_9PLEO|nr:uncharacterized protein N0V89_008930 [Didymosphaeria variabile]KAJ4350309.1 hypothetical protein N0V89_008930 [Didymosphaeria variabile]